MTGRAAWFTFDVLGAPSHLTWASLDVEHISCFDEAPWKACKASNPCSCLGAPHLRTPETMAVPARVLSARHVTRPAPGSVNAVPA